MMHIMVTSLSQMLPAGTVGASNVHTCMALHRIFPIAHRLQPASSNVYIHINMYARFTVASIMVWRKAKRMPSLSFIAFHILQIMMDTRSIDLVTSMLVANKSFPRLYTFSHIPVCLGLHTRKYWVLTGYLGCNIAFRRVARSSRHVRKRCAWPTYY